MAQVWRVFHLSHHLITVEDHWVVITYQCGKNGHKTTFNISLVWSVNSSLIYPGTPLHMLLQAIHREILPHSLVVTKCIHTHIHTHSTYTLTYTYIHPRTYAYTHTHTLIHNHRHTHTYTHTHAHRHIYMKKVLVTETSRVLLFLLQPTVSFIRSFHLIYSNIYVWLSL